MTTAKKTKTKTSQEIASRHVSRRQFLIGSGGAFLALPLLTSLIPERALAALAPRRRFVGMVGPCGVDHYQLYPANYADGTIVSGMESVAYKPLKNFTGQISRMIDSSFVDMYDHMNLIQGLSLTGGYYQGHNHCVLAGSHSGLRNPQFGATLDVAMEQSLNLYPASSAIPLKALRIGRSIQDGVYSWKVVPDPAVPDTMKCVLSNVVLGDKNLFNLLFANLGTGGASAQEQSNRKLVVDKVFEDLQRLQTNPRLSKDDKSTLDYYMTGIRDLQVKVGAAPPVCTKPTLTLQATGNGNVYQLPSDPRWGITSVDAMYDNYMKMIELAFACDLTRIVYINSAIFDNDPAKYIGTDYGLHHNAPSSDVAADRQNYGLKAMQKLARNLSKVTDPFGGGTLLDNSLVLWTNELGAWTTAHNTFSIPTVTFGKGGGYFKSGYHVDYRQRPLINFAGYNPGRPQKQLLQSIMLSMGMTKPEYSQYGDGSGFGEFKAGINQFGKVDANVFSRYAAEHNDPLPFLSIG